MSLIVTVLAWVRRGAFNSRFFVQIHVLMSVRIFVFMKERVNRRKKGNMTKPPAPASVSHLPAVFRTASDQPVLYGFTLNLEKNLAAVIRAAVARSADSASAAAALGLSVREMHRVAARHGVRLPWRPRAARKGGR